MHKYLRAIGFTRPLTRDEYGSLINEAILHPAYRAATTKTYYEEAPDTFSISSFILEGMTNFVESFRILAMSAGEK